MASTRLRGRETLANHSSGYLRDIVLDTVHVNTAFTYTCPESRTATRPTEIVLFRREEWFKVFLHETFHYYNLDFSSMDREFLKKQNKSAADFFNLSCQPDLYECYCETWARILNLIFLRLKRNETQLFFQHALQQEAEFACYQACRVLSFKGITYSDMIQHMRYVRDVYREKTNVFAYYVLTAMMLTNINAFMEWCYTAHRTVNPLHMVVFKKTEKNVRHFVQFVCQSAIHGAFLEKMESCEHAHYTTTATDTTTTNTSLRMTLLQHDLFEEPLAP